MIIKLVILRTGMLGVLEVNWHFYLLLKEFLK